MTRLSVNLNKIALVRNARDSGLPSLEWAAATALAAGAGGITVHPRPDERHVRATDLPLLSRIVSNHAGAEFNIEGNPFHNLLPLALEYRPHQVTLVPDAVDARTSSSGWRLPEQSAALAPVIERLHDAGLRVSLFMDPDPAAMARARALGADRIELYTEHYARHPHDPAVLATYAEAARAARQAGLGVNAGHDLDLANVGPFVRAAAPVEEVSIGHALTCDALDIGLAAAVRAYANALRVDGGGR